MPPSPGPKADYWLALCPACNRVQFVRTQDVTHLMRAGQPKCCGQPVTWYIKAGPLPAAGPSDRK
jgi:hypothetical protein